jgi:hypothetical protein
LLHRQPAGLEPDVHQPRAREVGVYEYRDHQGTSTARTVLSFRLAILPREVWRRKYDILHRL